MQFSMPLMQMSTDFVPHTVADKELFLRALQSVPGHVLDASGLTLPVVRYQHPDQAGYDSPRTGVFYLPQGSRDVRHYRHTGRNKVKRIAWGDYELVTPKPYGGEQEIKKNVLIKSPYFVKGATGGLAPQRAFEQMEGKKALKSLEYDIFKRLIHGQIRGRTPIPLLEEILRDHGGDPEVAWVISNALPQVGNNLRYAVAENVYANHARKRGYDSILGYSQKRDKTPFISELFNLNEQQYPEPDYYQEY